MVHNKLTCKFRKSLCEFPMLLLSDKCFIQFPGSVIDQLVKNCAHQCLRSIRECLRFVGDMTVLVICKIALLELLFPLLLFQPLILLLLTLLKRILQVLVLVMLILRIIIHLVLVLFIIVSGIINNDSSAISSITKFTLTTGDIYIYIFINVFIKFTGPKTSKMSTQQHVTRTSEEGQTTEANNKPTVILIFHRTNVVLFG